MAGCKLSKALDEIIGEVFGHAPFRSTQAKVHFICAAVRAARANAGLLDAAERGEDAAGRAARERDEHLAIASAARDEDDEDDGAGEGEADGSPGKTRGEVYKPVRALSPLSRTLSLILSLALSLSRARALSLSFSHPPHLSRSFSLPPCLPPLFTLSLNPQPSTLNPEAGRAADARHDRRHLPQRARRTHGPVPPHTHTLHPTYAIYPTPCHPRNAKYESRPRRARRTHRPVNPKPCTLNPKP